MAATAWAEDFMRSTGFAQSPQVPAVNSLQGNMQQTGQPRPGPHSFMGAYNASRPRPAVAVPGTEPRDPHSPQAPVAGMLPASAEPPLPASQSHSEPFPLEDLVVNKSGIRRTPLTQQRNWQAVSVGRADIAPRGPSSVFSAREERLRERLRALERAGDDVNRVDESNINTSANISNINAPAAGQPRQGKTLASAAGICLAVLGVAFKVFSPSNALGTAIMFLFCIAGAAIVVWALTWPSAETVSRSKSANYVVTTFAEAAQGDDGSSPSAGSHSAGANPDMRDRNSGQVVRARRAFPRDVAVPQRRDQPDANPFRPPPDPMDTFEQRLIAQGTNPDMLEGPRAGLGYRRAPLPGGGAPLAASALMQAPENSNMDEATFTEYMRQMNGEMPNQFYQAHPYYTFNANWDTRSQITDDQEQFGISSSPGQMNRKWKYKDPRLQQAGARSSHLKDPPPGAVPALDKTHPWLERDESGTESPAAMVTPLAAIAERAVATATSVEIEEVQNESGEVGARDLPQNGPPAPIETMSERKRRMMAGGSAPPRSRQEEPLVENTVPPAGSPAGPPIGELSLHGTDGGGGEDGGGFLAAFNAKPGATDEAIEHAIQLAGRRE
jgi:hypothetical protein